MKKWKIAAVGIAMAVLLTGCGGATVNGLTLPASLEIAAGESQAMELGYVFSRRTPCLLPPQHPPPLSPSALPWQRWQPPELPLPQLPSKEA